MIAFILVLLASKINGASFETCFHNGLCLGHLIEVQEDVITIEQCVENCKNLGGSGDCKYASFHKNAQTCALTKSCTQVVLQDQPYIYSSATCSRTVNKILNVGGIGNSGNPPIPNSELWSTGSTDQCQTIPDLKDKHNGAISGFVDGEPTICGGYHPDTDTYSNQCLRYDKEVNDFVPTEDLKYPVAFAAYAQWQGTKSMFFVGGQTMENGNLEILNTIQILGNTNTWTVPDLTFTCSCMVHLFDNTYYLMGGRSDTVTYSDKTFVLEWEVESKSPSQSEGPTLKYGRNRHMCGKVEDTVTNKKYAIVIGGLIENGMKKSCEYLEYSNDGSMTEWNGCSYVDVPIAEGKAISDPESGDLLFIGGKDENVSKNSIYRLSVNNNIWRWLLEDKTLQAERSLHTSLYVPDDKLPC